MSKYAFLVVFAVVAVLACNRVSAVNELPAVGAAAPSFSLTSNEGKQVNLNDFKGKWVVLYFYPKDDTPGCTKEACAFQDNLPKFKSSTATILGVSILNEASKARFAAKYKLTFPLLAAGAYETALRHPAIGEARREKVREIVAGRGSDQPNHAAIDPDQTPGGIPKRGSDPRVAGGRVRHSAG